MDRSAGAVAHLTKVAAVVVTDRVGARLAPSAALDGDAIRALDGGAIRGMHAFVIARTGGTPSAPAKPSGPLSRRRASHVDLAGRRDDALRLGRLRRIAVAGAHYGWALGSKLDMARGR